MLLEGLNEQQREAVAAGTGPVLVLAGPGSGKTRVLTHRIAYLIQEMGVSPSGIVAVTFTNKAAAEMRERVEKILGGRLQGLQIGTFHAICARLLRREHAHTPYGADYVIFDTDDQVAAITQALNELDIDQKKYNPRRVLGAISNAKNELIEPKYFRGQDYFGEIVGRAYPRYQAILLDNNALDFDDLMMQMVILLRDNENVRQKYQRFLEYVLVDEFQDTNGAQYRLVELFAAPQNNVFVVGDEDQGIYAFRGADYRNVLQFRSDYPDAKVILLEQNYRSTQNVLDAARAIIDRNPNRTRKTLFTDRGRGAAITVYEAYNDEYEARYVAEQIEMLRRNQGYAFSDIAIMYRTNAQSRAFEEVCIREGIPYKLVGGIGFYKRREVRDLLAYLRLVNNPNDKVSFARIINVPKRGIGKTSLQSFQAWAANDCASYDDALNRLTAREKTPLGTRAEKQFVDFGYLLRSWRELAATGAMVALFDRIMADIRYTMYLHEISEADEELAERSENLQQLRAVIAQAEQEGQPLADFLAENALVADVDELRDTGETVTLLTLHAAKGLEYGVVFLTGLEDGLMPHQRSFEDPEGMAEERRLLYVGITRSRDLLYLSYAFRRMMYGSATPSVPSRFLADVPSNLLDGVSSGLTAFRSGEGYRRETTWDRPANWQIPQIKPASEAAADDERALGSKARSKIVPFPRNNPPSQYPSGMKVKHPVFGVGTVIESRGSGDNEEITIAFEDRKHGIKKLLAGFANLKPVLKQ